MHSSSILKKKDEILSNCQTEDERTRTAELIRPILRGRDIKRYGYNWAGLYLIATFPSCHYDIEKYPAVKKYLLGFGIERLEQTGKSHIVNGEKIKARKKTNNKWFETQDSISYWDNYDVHSAANPVTRIISTVYGDKTVNLKEQLTWSPASNFSLTGRAGYFFRETVRSADQPERYRDFSGGLRMNWQISDTDDLQASYAFDQYDKSDYQRITRLDIRDYSNVQNSFRLLYNHTFGGGDVLTVGSDLLHDYLYNTNLEGETRKQDSWDLFAQYDWRLNDQWELVGALRYDYFSDGKDSHLTPKLNVCYKPLRNLAIRAGYGMGFRAPTLKEKYYNFDMSGIWIVEGNEHLKSEVSHNFNLSAEYTKGHYNYTASIYYNKVKDKLSTAAPYFKTAEDKLPYLPYSNLDDYSVCGGEVGAQAKWNNGLGARITYAYTKEQLAKDKDGNSINNQYIPAREHALNVRMDYDRQISSNYGLNIGLQGRVLSGVENVEYKDYYDVSKGTISVEYPAYTLWKLSLVQRIGKAVKVNAALDNLFGYKPKFYYLNSPITDGVTFQVGVSIDIDKFF